MFRPARKQVNGRRAERCKCAYRDCNNVRVTMFMAPYKKMLFCCVSCRDVYKEEELEAKFHESKAVYDKARKR